MTVAELLNDPSKWTQRAYARNEDEQGVSSRAEAAVSWCLLGAMNRCYSTADAAMSYQAAYARVCQALLTRPEVIEQMKASSESMPNPARWNDAPGRTFADVRKLVEQAGV